MTGPQRMSFLKDEWTLLLILGKPLAKSFEKRQFPPPAPCSPAALIMNSISFKADGSIQYKEKPYFSASEALDAYIDDFYLSCEPPDLNATEANVDQSPLELQAKPSSGKRSLFSEFSITFL
ncbi:hypothetical protein STEG23_015818 [Scotinomys teguina]